MWPHLIDLNPNEPVNFTIADQHGEVMLIDTTHHTQPDRWIDNPPVGEVIFAATVDLVLDGEAVTLHSRPYQMPTVHGRWRVAVELTRPWNVGIRTVPDFDATVRLAIAPADQPWGPTNLIFPLADYRWRADTYQNTWAGLVPYNLHYYHRGEDFGGIPSTFTPPRQLGADRGWLRWIDSCEWAACSVFGSGYAAAAVGAASASISVIAIG